MKKIVIISLFIFANVVSLIFALGDISRDNSILNQRPDSALDVADIDDPLRDGSYKVVNSEDGEQNKVQGLVDVDGKIDSFKEGQNTAEYHVMRIIKRTLNRALGLLGLIALIYLLYHGFLMVTSSGDETQFKKGFKGLKYAAIALSGIAISWFVISFIFWLIQRFTTQATDVNTSSQVQNNNSIPNRFRYNKLLHFI